MNDKLLKLQELLKIANDGLTRAEFTDAFKAVIDQVKKIEAELIATISTRLSKGDTDFNEMVAQIKEMRRQFETTVAETRKANDSSFAQIKTRAMESIASMMAKMDIAGQMSAMKSEHSAMMQKMETAMPDTEKMMAEMLAKMPEKTPEQIRDSLESIQEEEEKLAISAIAHLEEKLKDLEKKAGMSRGSVGGFNYGALQLHLVDDETPVGDIDSVNTVFTINNPPSPVSSLKVFLNGQRMRVTTDYTFSGVTITFLTAPPTTSILLVDYRT